MNSTANTSNKANSKTNKAIKAKSVKETVPERNSPRLHKSPPGMKSSDRGNKMLTTLRAFLKTCAGFKMLSLCNLLLSTFGAN